MYNAALQINPRWDDIDRVRAKEMLWYKLAKMGDFDIDVIRRSATFEEREEYDGRMILVATFEPRRDLHVVWTRDDL